MNNSDKINYLSTLTAIILLISTAFFYSKNIKLKKDTASQTPKIESENIFSDPIFSTSLITPNDWKTYRSQKYGIEFKYPPKYGGSEIKVDEGNPSANFNITLNDGNAGVILGINVSKSQSLTKQETKDLIKNLIKEELERRNDVYLQNSQEIIISPEITAYKISFLTKTICRNEKIGYERLFSYYYVNDYKQNSSAFINGESAIEYDQCPPDEPIIPKYQSRELYQNEFKQYIYTNQVISTIKFIK